MMVRADLGEVSYDDAMVRMDDWVAERQSGGAPDRLFLLSHPPVITYGRTTPITDLPGRPGDTPVVLADRGGRATYHGPGQLIGYLVLGLRERGPVDIVRWVESSLIGALSDLGFSTVRREAPPGSPSLVGVWTPDNRKLVSIGMRIRGGVTSHGFALNVDPDLAVFDSFVACGLQDTAMTSLRQLSVRQQVPMPSAADISDAVGSRLGAAPDVSGAASRSGRPGPAGRRGIRTGPALRW